MKKQLTCIELCAGAGGQSLGLEQAGFAHTALVEIDKHCCATLRYNRPHWRVIEGDMRELAGAGALLGAPDLLAAGLPCPPFSVAGKQLGPRDERDLFPAALELVEELQPQAVMIENVKGILEPAFHQYRAQINGRLGESGYGVTWRLLEACDYGVPQLRPRVCIVAFRKELFHDFEWPAPHPENAPTVGEALYDLMAANGWKGAQAWRRGANTIAPTLVGGSTKHGGPDLGPTRARRAWAALGVNGSTLAEEAPAPGFDGMPRLTVRMAARIQGFPDDWHFSGRKTNAYRQVGNAFPPPVAYAVARQVKRALGKGTVAKVA